MPGMDNAANVEEYLAAQPENVRRALEQVRAAIKTAAPEADETISYGVPTFKYHGPLVGLGASKTYCSLYVMSPVLMTRLKDQLERYDVHGATIRFPAERPLPAVLVAKVVKARMAENISAKK